MSVTFADILSEFERHCYAHTLEEVSDERWKEVADASNESVRSVAVYGTYVIIADKEDIPTIKRLLSPLTS